MTYQDYYQRRKQEVQESFLSAVKSGDTPVEKVVSLRNHLQEINEGKVTPTLAGVDAAVAILQAQQQSA